MNLTIEIFNAASDFAKKRRQSKGDAQAGTAEFSRSLIKGDEVILKNKPLSGWRFPEVELTRVKISDIQ